MGDWSVIFEEVEIDYYYYGVEKKREIRRFLL
jgi:hypothetical protein